MLETVCEERGLLAQVLMDGFTIESAVESASAMVPWGWFDVEDTGEIGLYCVVSRLLLKGRVGDCSTRSMTIGWGGVGVLLVSSASLEECSSNAATFYNIIIY